VYRRSAIIILMVKQKRYCKYCPEKLVYRAATICRTCYDRERKWKIRGINIDTSTYLHMLSKQNGLCLFCDRTPKPNRFFDVDHSHKTGVVRGLLCNEHNRAIGVVEKNIELLPKFLEYIK
jgi:hypothetical protein